MRRAAEITRNVTGAAFGSNDIADNSSFLAASVADATPRPSKHSKPQPSSPRWRKTSHAVSGFRY